MRMRHGVCWVLAAAVALAAAVGRAGAMPVDRHDVDADADAAADAGAFGAFNEVDAQTQTATAKGSVHSADKHDGFGPWLKMAWIDPNDNSKSKIAFRTCAAKESKAKVNDGFTRSGETGANVPYTAGLYEWATSAATTEMDPAKLSDDMVVRYVGKADGVQGLRQRCSSYMAAGKSFGSHLGEQFLAALTSDGKDLWYRWKEYPDWVPSDALVEESRVINAYYAVATTKDDKTDRLVVDSSAATNVFEWNSQGVDSDDLQNKYKAAAAKHVSAKGVIDALGKEAVLFRRIALALLDGAQPDVVVKELKKHGVKLVGSSDKEALKNLVQTRGSETVPSLMSGGLSQTNKVQIPKHTTLTVPQIVNQIVSSKLPKTPDKIKKQRNTTPGKTRGRPPGGNSQNKNKNVNL